MHRWRGRNNWGAPLWRGMLAWCLGISCGVGTVWADSIIVNGTTYIGVKILESSSRYYFRLPNGTSMSVSKSEVGADQIRFGDAKLPEPKSATPEPPKPAPAPEPPAPAPVPEPPKPAPAPEPPAPAPAPEPPKTALVPEPPAPAPAPEPPKPAPVPEPTAPMTPEETVQTGPPDTLLPPMAEQKPAPLYAGSASAVLWKKAKGSESSKIHVLLLKTEKTMVAFCGVDIGAMDDSLADRVLEKLNGQGSQVTSDGLWLIPAGMESKGIVEGPAKEAFWGRFNQQAAEEAAEKISAAIFKAEQTMAAAQVRIAEVEAPEWQKPRPDGSGTSDSTLTAMEVENVEGSSIAFLVNYAMNLNTSSDLRGFIPEQDSASRDAASESEVPVLFVNGAAGDIESVNSSNDKEEPSSLAIKMAQAILPVLDQEPARSEIALAVAGRTVILPPSALGTGISTQTRLRAVRIDDALCLSLPGIPSAQIGLLLRAQALTQGADHVFLMAQTGDALGYQPGVEEYFAVTDAVQDCHFGPLMILWYGQHSFARPADEESQEPIWSSIPILDRFSRVFGMAMDRGRQESEILQKAWDQDRARLEKNKAALLSAVDKHLDRLLKLAANEDPDTSFGALQEAVAAQCRRDMGIFSEEERVMLMGIAYGAGMPFDAVFLLQAFSRPNEWPQALTEPLQKSGVKGRDVLSTQGKML